MRSATRPVETAATAPYVARHSDRQVVALAISVLLVGVAAGAALWIAAALASLSA